MWRDSSAITCEVRDSDRLQSPLVDRERPAPGAAGSRGLWLANQLCDLVQIRTFATGTAVRLHMWLKAPAVAPDNSSHTLDSVSFS